MKPDYIYAKREERYELRSNDSRYSSYKLRYSKEFRSGSVSDLDYNAIDIEGVNVDVRFSNVPLLQVRKGDELKISRFGKRTPKDLLVRLSRQGLPSHVKDLLKEAGLVSRL